MGFRLEDSKLKRAGLDYHEWANLTEHANFEAFLASIKPARILACTTRGRNCYSEFAYQPGDALLFGPETRGLPQALLDTLPAEQRLRIPMLPNNRSLNLSNAVAIMLYEAWRQQGFVGARK